MSLSIDGFGSIQIFYFVFINSELRIGPLMTSMVLFLITTYKMCVNMFESLLLTIFFWLTFAPLNVPLQKKKSERKTKTKTNSQKIFFYDSHETFKFYQSNKLYSFPNIAEVINPSVFALTFCRAGFVCLCALCTAYEYLMEYELYIQTTKCETSIV